ncbi:glycosyltransferase family 9 protein [Actinophytocola gossypii]|uniref:Glycosyltransferase family 9 protein n=1 Tax=Actinophytocola gossypii TaxID=2812003 RepID=A0ABT2J9A7_9PSEU|nr:glycosyltransferase family 9 protein [Actinophytocola gossypii]MCT2584450.1 glycosyltransferase family 9 protein [Actinophytocola gossypii]
MPMGEAIGPLEPRWSPVRRIAVLRGGGLGDLLFAVPALDALAAAYPDAEVVLLGAPGPSDLLAGRPGPVHRVVPLPPAHGVHEPPGRRDPAEDAAARRRFADRVGPVDLGVQLHGGGRWSNPFLLSLDPKWTVGARTGDAVSLTRWIPYRYYQNEVMRGLEIAGLAGAPPVRVVPRIARTPADRDAAERALSGLPRPLLTVHPGATDPRRRWPPERFAEVAVAVARAGAGVVVLGTPAERDLVELVTKLANDRLPDGVVRALTDLDLDGLCGVLDASTVVLANDSGPRHLAEAVGTATVGVYWMGNALNASSFGRARNRVLISWTSACPVCGVDCTREDLPRCPHDVSFVSSVPTGDAVREVTDLLG